MADETDRSLRFRINEDKGGEDLYFKRRNNKLWKLGDGTFGVVYVVHSDLRGNDFAAKLLYDNESTTPRPLSRLPAEAVKSIAERVLEEERWPEERAAALRKALLATYQKPDALGMALAQAELQDWEPILAKIRKRANSTAVERFNRESRVSGIIRTDQLSRSAQAQVSGTVDIIGSTRRFQSYPAYQQLKDEFAEAGVSVSDYALVMDKFEFSLKDLLERGPDDGYRIAAAAPAKILSRGGALGSRDIAEKAVEEPTGQGEEEGDRPRTPLDTPEVGYELLRQMSYEARIRSSLPVLQDIVVALSRLDAIT